MASRKKEEFYDELLDEELEGIAFDAVHEGRSKKFLVPLFIGALCCVALIVFGLFIWPLRETAKNIGQVAGASSGYVAGIAVGSVEGATQGIQTGYAEGTEEGLSGKDTIAEIANTIEGNLAGLNDHGRLEVLAAKVDMTQYYELGKKYGALYFMRGNAVFSIDLNKVSVTYGKDVIAIVLPRPTVEVTIDHRETETIAEWQTRFFDGTDRDGFEGLLNSINNTSIKNEEAITNYSALMEYASSSAIKRIEEIAKAARGSSNIEVTVSMMSN